MTMNSLKLFLFFAILWSSPLLPEAWAQSANPPRPKEPIVSHAPNFASWTITYTYREVTPKSPAKPVAPSDRIQSVTLTKTDKTYWMQTTWTSGKKEEKWIFNGIQFETLANGKVVTIIAAPTPEEASPEYLNFSGGDFPELEWVSAKNYKTVEDYEGKKAFRFEEGDKKALLSIETQLPINSDDGDLSLVYTFNSPPIAPLVPPKRFLDVLATYRRGLEAQKYHPSPP